MVVCLLEELIEFCGEHLPGRIRSDDSRRGVGGLFFHPCDQGIHGREGDAGQSGNYISLEYTSRGDAEKAEAPAGCGGCY